MIRVMFLRSAFVVFFVLLLYLAFACLQVAKLASPFYESHRAQLLWNPFADKSAEQYEKLEKASAESLRRLEFMTFSQERKRAAALVVQSLREQINLYPYNAQWWGLLVDMEAESKQQSSERTWTMEASLTLGKWNTKYHLAIASYCLDESLALLKYNPALCQQLLNSLPYSQIQRNAHGMGVNYKYLTTRLNELNKQYGLNPSAGGSNE